MTMHPTIEMIVKKSADLRQDNFFTTDKVAVFILDFVDIQDTRSTVLNDWRTDRIIAPNFRKIYFCN